MRASARRVPVIRCCTESEAAVDAGFWVLWAAEAAACFSAFTVPCCRKMAASFLLMVRLPVPIKIFKQENS